MSGHDKPESNFDRIAAALTSLAIGIAVIVFLLPGLPWGEVRAGRGSAVRLAESPFTFLLAAGVTVAITLACFIHAWMTFRELSVRKRK
jgi:hypothetical protein